MDCIGPATPDITDFLAYADNAASAAVREHISACAACRTQAFLLRREQRALQALLYRAGCPAPLALGEYHLGTLSEPRASGVAEHLRECPACRSELVNLAAFLQQLRRPVADAASDVFSSLRIVVGRLSAGPAAGPFPALAPALRGAGDDSESGPAVYDAEDVTVTVDSWIERLGQPGRAVAGLVAGPVDFRGAEASMVPAAPGAAPQANTLPISDLGNFLFSNVAPGVHQLMIRLPATGIQIQIDELTVK